MPKKSLVVGLGGTGDWVLAFLKSRLFSAYGEEATKKDVQFLLVDTIHARTRESAFEGTGKITVGYTDQHDEQVARLGQVRVENLEYLPLVGSIQGTADSIQRKETHTRHLSWFPADFYLSSLPAAAMDITLGAGQWRQFGRMALVLGTERGDFTGKLRKLMNEANVDPNDNLMVYVVCSLGGGTGAGMFLDAAAVIRDVASKISDLRVWVVGFLLLPGAFRYVWNELVQKTAIPRSYAAFRELSRFQTVAGRNVPFPIRYSINDSVKVSTKLYDTVFLLDAVDELAEAPPWSGVSPCIADGLEVFIDRTRGSQILENLVNASAKMAGQVQMNQTLPAQFHSMGSHKIVLPARQYAHIFTSQFAQKFFEEIFPKKESDGGPPNLRKSDVADPIFVQLALDSMKDIPNLFTKLVDYMPGRPAHSEIEKFANATINIYRSLLAPEKDDASLNLPIFDVDPLDPENEDEPLPTSDVTKEEPEVAAKEVELVCKQRTDLYWLKVNETTKKVKALLDNEMAIKLETHVAMILNADVSDARSAPLRDYPVRSAIDFLDQIALQCDGLIEHVLARTEERIRKRNFTPEQWRVRVNQAKTQMEAKFNGFFKRSKSASAQKAYVGELRKLVESEKMALMFKTFREITWALKSRANTIRQDIMDWAKLAVLDKTNCAHEAAGKDIASINDALKAGGRSYTSSYGLKPYTGGEVDPTMNGYQQRLYKRIAEPLVDTWVKGHSWKFVDHNLTLNVTTAEQTTVAERTMVKSGEDLYRWVFKQVEGVLLPQVTSLSIFDYFLEICETEEDRAKMPETVAEFLKRYTRKLMPALQQFEDAQETRDIYLLVKKPQKPEAVEFYHDLVNKIKQVYVSQNEAFQEGMTEDFDNPYTLTLLYLIQDIRPGQIPLLNDYEEKYNEAISESDAHIVNHVFRCEQEAAKLERMTNAESGTTGQSWTRINARVCRLLDVPNRVKLFFQLLALKIIRLAEPPNRVGSLIWMILPPGNENPAGPKVVWLTRPTEGNEDDRQTQSLLLAIECFCLKETSAKPGGGIPIPYQELEVAHNTKRAALVSDGDYGNLINAYEEFLNSYLNSLIEEYVDSQDAISLKVVAKYYLQADIQQLRANQLAKSRFN
jgi:tubulin-like protein